MSTPRIRHRVESASVISSGYLPAHSLEFHKKSVDGSAKCDIELTQNPNDIVYGVVFQLLVSDKLILDDHEGLGNGYDEKDVAIVLPDGSTIEATTYYATHIDKSLLPYHWYKQHVLRGAREHALPVEHIKSIQAITSIADPDEDKHYKELSIYSRSY